jgi:hypothetical protein
LTTTLTCFDCDAVRVESFRTRKLLRSTISKKLRKPWRLIAEPKHLLSYHQARPRLEEVINHEAVGWWPELPSAHLGTIIKGVLHVVSDDGSEITVHAGEAYVFAPGHDARVVGDKEVVAYEFNTEAKDFANWKNYKA